MLNTDPEQVKFLEVPTLKVTRDPTLEKLGDYGQNPLDEHNALSSTLQKTVSESIMHSPHT